MKLLSGPIKWVIGALLAALLIAFAVNSLTKSKQQAAQAKLDAATGKAGAESAKDAINAVEASGRRSEAIDETTRENERAIREAEGSKDRVNPAVHGAGLAGLCKRAAYRCNAECLQLVDPGRMEEARSRCAPANR
jgi:hypothetical protein